MRTRIGCLCIVVWMSLWATASHGAGTVTSSSTVDSDSNDIEDRYETGLADKFVPAMVLDARDNVSPEPVSFIGAHSKNNLWVAMYNSAGKWKFDKRLRDVNPRAWDPPLIDETVIGIKSNGDFSSLRSPVIYTGRPGESSQSWAHGAYILIFHFEYTGGNSPASWRESYQTEAESNSHPDQVYAHLFKRSSTNEYVIQYWYFYPFNNWVNNHEGDWEHINVVVSSQDPARAQLKRVEFYFHHKFLNRSQPGTDFYVSDGTHPIIFTGGYQDYSLLGVSDKGTGGHGSYPSSGTWRNVVDISEFDSIADQPNGLGRYIHWSEFQIEVIKDPLVDSAYDFDAHPEMSWLKANILWGQPEVKSPGASIPIKDLLASNNAPSGPRYNAAWGVVSADDREYERWTGTPPHSPVTESNWNMLHVPGDYTTIRAAIAAADSGTTIQINPGTYNESLTMKSGVHLRRSYGTVTIVPSSGYRPVALFSGVNEVKVEGITFRGALVNGVEIVNSSNITLAQCDFTLRYG